MCWQKSTAACSLIHGMQTSCANIMSDIFILLIKIQCFSSYICYHVTLSSSPSTEGVHQPNNKNNKSQKEMTRSRSG
jgi:hypothetical protein